jgi:hypothetical protein
MIMPLMTTTIIDYLGITGMARLGQDLGLVTWGLRLEIGGCCRIMWNGDWGRGNKIMV